MCTVDPLSRYKLVIILSLKSLQKLFFLYKNKLVTWLTQLTEYLM